MRQRAYCPLTGRRESPRLREPRALRCVRTLDNVTEMASHKLGHGLIAASIQRIDRSAPTASAGESRAVEVAGWI